MFLGSCRDELYISFIFVQPLDSNHHFKVIVVVVTFVGKWVTASVIQLIHKKSSRSTMRTTKCGLIKRFSPAAYLNREQGSDRYLRLRAYYKGFDPELTY
jgi:hypothetical protein